MSTRRSGPGDALTASQMRVLQYLRYGLSNAAIARRMFIQPGTVKNHISEIMSKLDVDNRVLVVLAAMEAGILPCPCSERLAADEQAVAS
ncbi:response regulator transcription factor [Kibdelosporangium phytohabitans]|uniref:HTH luxR-type domain-containing protein n=1 Tax=Kibdelosporangium phytohabitans TaxID=860235 RepID=A0A0N9HTR6_9PSEU|nr:LuxR C-terminal-related transcriptional regulator [Kibdelosporangium phytohabitans]ALG06826.1 hypothetical protein AOZ06_07695 [Kibdelosporangium phytohabitans]MBE1468071.1 DNA-binding NarL/FixJ family response regulator [Kibdelosporangium phytohabitans]